MSNCHTVDGGHEVPHVTDITRLVPLQLGTIDTLYTPVSVGLLTVAMLEDVIGCQPLPPA